MVATILSATDSQIIATVPNQAIPGENIITVSQGSSTSNGFAYTVLSGDQNQIIFHVNANTYFGENIYVVGNIPELGSWDTNNCSEAMMCPNYPNWFLPISVPANTIIEFKFIRKDSYGNVTWESSNNRVIYSSSEETGVVDTINYNWGQN